MATQPKVNPTLPNVARHFNGKSVTAVKVTLGAVTDPDDFGPDGVVQAVYETLAENATPIIISQIAVGTGIFDVYFEGDFLETDDYGSAGTLSFIEDLEDRIQALGTVNGIDVSGATAVALSTLIDDTTGTAGLVGDGGVDIS